MTAQAPLGSGFGEATTAREALGDVRLDGVVAIVTGGHGGIGLETTRVLADAGATVVVASRSPVTIEAGDRPRVEAAILDLAEPASIARFADAFLASGRPLGLLVNNAGVMAAPLHRDARGFESHFATNHLGHFALTARLWPALRKANGARVVTLTSRGHVSSGIDFDDPFFERRGYDRWVAYGQSKTANVLFTVALDERGASHGIRGFAVHPGSIPGSGLMRFLSDEDRGHAIAHAKREGFVKSIAQGAATTVWCATSPALGEHGGVYCEDCDVAKAVPGDASGPGVRPWAIDRALAERLWSASEAWTGTTLV